MTSLTKSNYVILGLLSKADYSGYELKKRIAKTSSLYLSESNAHIYPILKQLEERGLVNSTLDESSGARNKRIFRITKKGQNELIKWLKEDSEIALYREEFLLQLSLAQHLSHNDFIKKISHYQQSVNEKLQQVNQIVPHIKSDHKGKKDQRYLLLTYDHIKTVLDAKLKWCDKVLKNLAKARVF